VAAQSINVLVVEDYKAIIHVVRNQMQQLGFPNIDHAQDAKAALSMIGQKRFGLAFSDNNMEPVDGIELLKRIRQRNKTKDFPVVMFTADATATDIINEEAAGAPIYTVKLFEIAVLKQKFTGVLGGLR